ncbi:MAG: dockerin type I domain-containing protein [Pirellulaceae bacterium]|nr:PEP-CTERM sorting domain-containing protein [Planctomycetales bacterium]
MRGKRYLRTICIRCRTRDIRTLMVLVGLVLFSTTTCSAISLDQIDDFQSGSTLGWQGGSPSAVANAGPNGAGDFALRQVATGSGGFGSRLIVHNSAQWQGDWTAAGIEQISLDVRNPNNIPLSLRLGIAGPGGVSGGGTGDVWVTPPMSIPTGDVWQTVVFDVAPDNWINADLGTDINAALAAVSEMRILHNANVDYRGAVVNASMFIDNIKPLAAVIGLPGDYNGNGSVDAADYTVWKDNFGSSSDLAADGNGNGTIDAADYTVWKDNFGNGGPGITAVPEPTSWISLLVVAAAIYSQRRR